MVLRRKSALYKVDFSSNHVDEVGEILSKRFAPVVCEPVGHKFLVGLSATMGVGPGVDFSTTTYTYGMRIVSKEAFDGMFFCIPLDGTMSWGSQGAADFSAQTHAIAVDGRTLQYFESAPGLVFQRISASRDKLRERLSVLLDHSINAELLFQPIVDVKTGQLKAISMLTKLLTSSEFQESLSFAPTAANRLIINLIDMLVETWPNNYSDKLRQIPAMISPRHVKLALGYINDNPQEMPSPEELSKLCNVSLRSLQIGFLQFVGMSIVAYQRKVRLERARKDLLDGDMSVDTIARRWGFSNPGRFAKYFKEAFGVSPATLLRNRELGRF